jgi:dTDP-4-dehydrorhamnose reductase
VALPQEQADLTHTEHIRTLLTELRPDVVVNCGAYNLVDRAESEPDAAFAVNAWGVRHLAQVSQTLGAVLVHFSTDYIFGLDESRRTPYGEEDPPGPLGVYGLSKLAGEYLVRSLCPRHFIVRTCGLYGLWGSGGKGTNFVETMLRLAGQGKPLRVVADQTCTPSYTVDVATATAALVTTGRFGLYHIVNAESCSWFQLAAAIFELAGLHADLTPIASSQYPVAARRPRYSVMSCGAYQALGLPPLRTWRQALAAYLEERRNKRQ